MKKLMMLLGAALLVSSAPSFAGGDKKMDPKMMDTNGDGMISRDEFMRHHEMMWDKMKKNSSGMVDVKEMQDMHKMMHKSHKDMKDMKDKAK